MRKQLEVKDEVNRMLVYEIPNLKLQLEGSRKFRFGRTFEQRRLLITLTLTSLQWISPNMTALTRRMMIAIRLVVTQLAAIPLFKRKGNSTTCRKEQAEDG